MSRHGLVFPRCLAGVLLCAGISSADATPIGGLPSNYSSYALLPRATGFELRSTRQVLPFDAEGQPGTPVEEAHGVARIEFSAPSALEDRWTLLLPESAQHDAVAVTALGHPYCERVRMEDGRRLTRLRALPPYLGAPGGVGFTFPPNIPAPPSGGLGRAVPSADEVYRAALATRDAEGNLYSLAWSPAGDNRYSLLASAVDCEPLWHLNDVRIFSAHAAHPGVYLVRPGSTSGDGLRIERHLRSERLWTFDLAAALGVSVAPQGSLWMQALADGDVLVIASIADPASALALARISAAGELRARQILQGVGVAAVRETPGGLLLALREVSPHPGAGSLVSLDARLGIRAQRRLPEGYVHGPLSSAAEGMGSSVWLWSETAERLPADDFGLTQRFGALRVDDALAIEWLQPPSDLKPRLVLADGALLRTRRTTEQLQLSLLRRDGTETATHAAVILPPPISPPQAFAHREGWAQLWQRYYTSGHVPRLRFLEADGRERWNRALPVGSGEHTLLEGPGADRVCVLLRGAALGNPTELSEACYALADGSDLATARLPELQSGVSLSGFIAPSGRSQLRAWLPPSQGRPTTLRLQRVLADGSIASRDVPATWQPPQSLLADNGALTFLYFDDPPDMRGARLQRVDAEGRILAEAALGDGFSNPRLLASAASGETVVGQVEPVAGVNRVVRLRGFGADLSQRWQIDVTALGVDSLSLPSPESGIEWLLEPQRRSWVIPTVFDQRITLISIDAETGEALHAPLAPSMPVAGSYAALRLALAPLDRPGAVAVLRMHGTRTFVNHFEPVGARMGATQELGTPWFEDRSTLFPAADGFTLLRQRSETGDAQVLRLAASLPAAASAPGPEHSGLWYDPQVSGQGLMLDVDARSQRWFAAWFTFALRPEGGASIDARLRRTLRWYSMLGQGGADTGMPIAGTLYATAGGRFEGGTPQTRPQGRVALRAIDCNTLEFAYSIDPDSPQTQPVMVGARRLQRLGPAPAACGGASMAEQSGLRSASTGSWVLEGRPNQGLLMQVDPGAAGEAGAVWGAWFGFDAGEPDDPEGQHWLTVIGRSLSGQPGVVELEWMRSLGGGLDEKPTSNTLVIGTGRLRFTACDRAVLEYSFDAPGLAGDAFAGLQGQVNLRRFATCD